MSVPVLEMSRKLEDAGFTELQVEGIVESVMEAVENSDWVTKEFLRAELTEVKTELRTEIGEVKTELKTEIAQLETRLTGKMAEQETKLMGNMAELETRLTGKMAILETTMIKWMIGLQIPTWALILTLKFH